MYITYERFFEIPDLRPLTRTTRREPRAGLFEPSEFKPTWLIRIKDMKKVRGSDVHEQYFALSYSWSQSGDISKSDDDQKYTRTDSGEHKIITYREKRGRNKDLFTATKRLVKFEGLIQQICRDFDIRYIWYDQMCIDQNNPEEKRREIRQMHKIYGNAQCTVVLVPEFQATHATPYMSDNTYYISRKSFRYVDRTPLKINAIAKSEWSSRMWTLEEAFVSKRLLFIGRDTYLWSHSRSLNYDKRRNVQETTFSHAFLTDICTKSENWTASTILWHARQRTSSKVHDRIFALANLYPKITQDLSFDDKQPLLNTMLHFYSLLVQYDLSILCFGVPDLWPGEEEISFRQPEDELLPSWTGASGSHAPRLRANNHTSDTSIISWSLSGRLLHLTCNCIRVLIERRDYQYSESSERYKEVPRITSSLHAAPYDRSFLVFAEDFRRHSVNLFNSVGLRATHYLRIVKAKYLRSNIILDQSSRNPWEMSLVDAGCKECMILSGVKFQSTDFAYVMPVVQRDTDGYYRCIGSCIEFIKKEKELNFSYLERKQTIIIK